MRRYPFWLAFGAAVGWASAMRGAGDKAQVVRLVDVLALGPLLSMLAVSGRWVPGARPLLAAAGAATITYNAVNYLRGQSAAPLAAKVAS